ncbi:hypothetical protein ScPMuIL_009605 [Solemya velum]
MSDEIEIIEFKRPEGSRKNLFITGIPHSSEDQIINCLHKVFEKYGLLYGVQIYPYSGPTKKVPACTTGSNVTNGNQVGNGYYGFVTFYSTRDAHKAKDSLNNRVYICGSECKIAYAKRKKQDDEIATKPASLHFSRCQELANQYIGFNSWSITIKVLEEEKGAPEQSSCKVQYLCLCRVDIVGEGLHSEGFGAWEEAFLYTDPTSRGKAICKCKKLAYQRAVEDAFSKFLLVVLPNSKVFVEFDTTRIEPVLTERELDEENHLQVNNLDDDPLEEETDFTEQVEDEEDIDAMNLHILHELEDEF